MRKSTAWWPRVLTLPVLLVAAALLQPAEAALRIEITEGVTGARPIAVVPFAWQGEGPAPLDVAEVVRADLARTGHFSPVAEADLPARPTSRKQIEFSTWRQAKIDNLVIGALEPAGGGAFRLEFRLFDALRGSQLTAYRIPVRQRGLRYAAHEVSNYVYEKLVGEPGVFNTRIAYVTSERKGDGQRYRLMVADADGRNARTALTSGEPIMSPAWSPDSRQIAYVSFESGRAAVYVQEVATGERRRVTAEAGINGAPAFSPDGGTLAVTLSTGGNPDIWLIDLESGERRRLTRSPAIDTEPAFTPDGRRLAFTSDRGGGPQIYTVPTGGGTVRRVTYEGGYNASPEWGPEGRSLAMVHRSEGRYRIAVLNTETRGLRVLTDGPLDESPSFAPNGSMIMYADESGARGVLRTVSFDGRARQRLSGGARDVREPAWSPLEGQ